MKYFFITVGFLVLLVVATAGFRGTMSQRTPIELFDDMVRQQKVKYQKPSEFFADGRGARLPVPGTVPVNVPVDHPAGEYFYTGAIGNQWGDGLPMEVTLETLKRGQEKFSINCAVCHGATGGGNGITSQYGLNGIANFHQDMYRTMPDGQIFNTITKGKGQMMGYGANIKPEDRWAIIAYIRVLQRSQNARIEDVPASERTKFEKP